MSDDLKFHDLVSLRRALDDRLRRLEQDLKRSTGDVHAQVEKRKALARSLELSRRLVEMYEQVRPSPNWEAINPMAAGPEPPGEAEKRTAQAAQAEIGTVTEERLRFEQNGRHYAMHLIRHAVRHEPGAKGLVEPTQLAFCGGTGAVLFAVDVMEESAPHGPAYRPADVTAFLPGNWVKDFLELSEQVSALKKELELRRKYDPAEVRKLKQQFGL